MSAAAAASTTKHELHHLYEKETGTITYILVCKETKLCAVFDPVLDVDVRHGMVTHESADKLLAKIKELGVTVQWIIETHCHADHASCSQYLKAKLAPLQGGAAPPVAIGDKIVDVIRY